MCHQLSAVTFCRSNSHVLYFLSFSNVCMHILAGTPDMVQLACSSPVNHNQVGVRPGLATQLDMGSAIASCTLPLASTSSDAGTSALSVIAVLTLQDLMADMRNEAAVGVVAQLTALRRLLTFGDITMSGLLQLTQLQQLTQLVLIRGVASVRNTRRQSARRRRMQSLKLCCKPVSVDGAGLVSPSQFYEQNQGLLLAVGQYIACMHGRAPLKVWAA